MFAEFLQRICGAFVWFNSAYLVFAIRLIAVYLRLVVVLFNFLWGSCSEGLAVTEKTVVNFNVQFNNSFAADLRWSILLYPLVVLPFAYNSGFVGPEDVVSFNPEAFCFWGKAPFLVYNFHVDAIEIVRFVY